MTVYRLMIAPVLIRMGLVWRVRRLAASAWAELILWSLWSLVVLFSIGLPIYLGANYLCE